MRRTLLAGMVGRGGGGAVLTGVLFAVLGFSGAVAEPQHAGAPVEAEATQLHAPAAPGAKAAKDSQGKISKFEARHMRHACREKADEKGYRGAEREAFMQHCFFGRRVARGECRKKGLAQGLDKSALQEFIHNCVKEARGRAKPAD